MNLKLDDRQARALKVLIQISQSDAGLDQSLKYELATILPLLEKTAPPPRNVYRSTISPFILGKDNTRLLTPVEPDVVKKIFRMRGVL